MHLGSFWSEAQVDKLTRSLWAEMEADTQNDSGIEQVQKTTWVIVSAFDKSEGCNLHRTYPQTSASMK